MKWRLDVSPDSRVLFLPRLFRHWKCLCCHKRISMSHFGCAHALSVPTAYKPQRKKRRRKRKEKKSLAKLFHFSSSLSERLCFDCGFSVPPNKPNTAARHKLWLKTCWLLPSSWTNWQSFVNNTLCAHSFQSMPFHVCTSQ